MLARVRRRASVAIGVALVAALGTTLAAAAPSATASNEAIVIPFQKTFQEQVPYGPCEFANYYTGTVEGGTVAMWVYCPRIVGGAQHFTATLELTVGERSLAAGLEGRYIFATERVVLNGHVTNGWLAGARVHEESVLADGGFAGTIQLMPGSASR
jgi:hypothetical protein